MIYAVKINGHWYIATKTDAAKYGIRAIRAQVEVWAERGTTAYLGSVGDEERFVELEGVTHG